MEQTCQFIDISLSLLILFHLRTDVLYDEEEKNNEDEIMIAKAQGLIDKIIASPHNPKPICLHALASILETQEARSYFSLSFCICKYTYMYISTQTNVLA
uniref:Uncharacterized protein n=1 Tax=Lactuca sativa TaxID=4236 RepID=A0A9R1XTT7_LACSA|nr:hypothetical protein LSAT_V11C200092740 [Lactuca sativa]